MLTIGGRRRLSLACLAVLTSCTGNIGGNTSDWPPNTAASDLPCEVETVLNNRCWGCHGATPAEGLPALTTVAALRAPARSDASKTTAELALSRMQNDGAPMPPAPASRVTPDEIAVLAAWVSADYPSGTGCAPICTSNVRWTGGNEESPRMNPGRACIQCHTNDEGPRFSVAGTLYPTAHEPDLCNGVDGVDGATVVITGADGQTLTLAPNRAGNFFTEQRIALPYEAKVVLLGRERVMTEKQTSGDCNGCHTQTGTNNAPGRIQLP